MTKISLLIPTFNRQALLARALASCLASPPNCEMEIIVLDNCSTDSTQAWLEKYVTHPPQPIPANIIIRVVRHAQNLGMAGNWQAGLLLARGQYIKILCDDDILLPGALQREFTTLEKGPHLGLVACARREVDRETSETRLLCYSSTDCEFSSEETLRAMILEENIFGPPSAVLFRKKFLVRFDDYFSYATDWAAWLTIAQNSTVAYLAQPGCEIDLHQGNLTKQMIERDVDFFEVFELRFSAWQLLRRRNAQSITDGLDFYRLVFYRCIRRILRHGLAQEFSRVPYFLHEWILYAKRLQINGIRF